MISPIQVCDVLHKCAECFLSVLTTAAGYVVVVDVM